jgi:bifunctional enzyme CysN/CysC
VTDNLHKPWQCGSTLWITGLPAAGKTSLAHALERRLAEFGRIAVLLDGDVLRAGLSSDLGTSPADRSEQARRTAHLAALIAGAGPVAIVALVSPYAADRRRARELHDEAGLDFHEVFLDTPLRVCEQRDPKGLYARARAGLLAGMTGVDAPYEPPLSPAVRVRGGETSPDEAACEILAATQVILAEEVGAARS